MSIWKGYAKEYLGVTHHLENKVCIYFDRWFSSSAYRESISQLLNMKFTDKGFSVVSSEGGGSSFDGTKFDGNNGRMDVLNRQDNLNDLERELLDSVLSDVEIQDLAKRVASG